MSGLGLWGGAGGGKATVAKVQVALTGNARSLQRELERIAKRADTNTSEGLHYVLVRPRHLLLPRLVAAASV